MEIGEPEKTYEVEPLKKPNPNKKEQEEPISVPEPAGEPATH